MKSITAETELDRAYVSFEQTFKISHLNAYQLTAIKIFRTGNSDAVPPESICTSAAGFTRWTQGQCTRFALASTSRGTNVARDETKTKPRETRILQWPRLRALNCLCLLFVCVSLLVIRSHLPKRFSRKPQLPLAISSMHRLWLHHTKDF